MNLPLARYLKHNASCETPRHLIFVDTETKWTAHPTIPDAQRHVFRLAVACAVRFDEGRFSEPVYTHFVDERQFWDWLVSKMRPKTATWLFAHNTGFDLSILRFWEKIAEGVFRLSDETWLIRDLVKNNGLPGKPWRGQLVLEDPPTIITCKKDNCTLKIVDTLNYWPMSLAQLGQQFDLPKLQFPGEHGTCDEWLRYCTRDVEVIQRAVCHLLDWWRTGNRGNWSYTCAGLAMNHYRHAHLAEPILLHGQPEVQVHERRAYYGGRVAVFRAGKIGPTCPGNTDLTQHWGELEAPCGQGPLYHLDVNSLYPSVMLSNNFPCKLESFGESLTNDDLCNLLKARSVVVEVEIDTDEVPFPVRVEGRTVYALGRYWTSLASPELHLALELNLVRSVGKVTVYRQAPLFTSYVEALWSERCRAVQDGRHADALLAKMLLNSLSGKFAQRSHRWDDCLEESSPIPFGPWWKSTEGQSVPQLYRSIAWHTQRCNDPGETSQSFPAISAHITSAARVRMLSMISVARPENVFYMDTDSLHVNKDGHDRLHEAGLVCEHKLGALRLVEKADSAEYRGPKHYRFGGREVIAGVKANAVAGAGGEFRQQEFQRLVSVLSGTPDGSITVRNRVIRPAASTKLIGTVGADGLVVPPTVRGSYDEHRSGTSRVASGEALLYPD